MEPISQRSPVREAMEAHKNELEALGASLADLLSDVYGEKIDKLTIHINDVKSLSFTWTRD